MHASSAKIHGMDVEGAPFVLKTYQLVSDTANGAYVTWSETRDSFVVLNPVDFSSDILPKYFKHNNFCSFIRQLNTYNFHRVENKQWEFQHEFFKEGFPGLLKDITRRKSKKRDAQTSEQVESTKDQKKVNAKQHSDNSAVPACAFNPNTTSNSPRNSNPSSPLEMSTLSTPEHVTQTSTPAQNQNHSPSNVVTSQVLTTPSNSSPLSIAPSSSDEIDQLKEMNTVLMKEILRLRQQQDSTNDTIKQILSELITSRDQQNRVLSIPQENLIQPQPNYINFNNNNLYGSDPNTFNPYIIQSYNFTEVPKIENQTIPTQQHTQYQQPYLAQQSTPQQSQQELTLDSFLLASDKTLFNVDEISSLDLGGQRFTF